MKRISLSFFAILYAITSLAQITITVDDLIDVGDSVNLAVVDSVPPDFGPGPAGPNNHWDYSNLTMDTTSVLKFIDPANTPYGNEFPSSNVAVEGIVEDLGLEGYAYGTRNDDLFQIDGGGGSYDIFEDIIVPFDPPEVMFDFPINYLDSSSQTTVIQIEIESPEPGADSVRVKVTTTVESKIDAWGEISTPVWTGQVLRFRDVRTTIDSTWIKVLFFWIFLDANEDISVMYKYMGNDIGYPVLTFNADTSDSNFSSINYHLDAGVGEAELPVLDHLAFEVFPNPANDVIHCRFGDAFKGEILVYDLTGRIQHKQPVASGQKQIKLDVSNFPAGMYQVVARGQGQILSVKKIIVY